MSFKRAIFPISSLFTVGFYFLAIAPSANAFSFSSGGDQVTIGATDIGKSFEIDFNGNVATTNVSGLSSTAIFTFNGFTTVGSGSSLETKANFNISLSNTSTNGITSRTSALGFNTSNPLRSDTSVSGLFTNDAIGGAFPNNFGNIGVCFNAANTCQGGANGGLSTGQTASTFSPILAFSGNVSSFTLSNFGVRYQSITGTNLGTSGTGHGYYTAPPKPRKVPESSTVAALALFTLVALSLTKKSKACLC